MTVSGGINSSSPKLLWFVALIFFLSYLPTFRTPYLLDDSHTVQSNQFVHSLKHFFYPWTSAKAYSSTPENYGYRPVAANFAQVMWAAGNGSPIPFQIFKKLILLGLALLVLSFWTKLQKLRPSHFGNELSVGARLFLFCVVLLNPINTQTANYIAASSSLLCAFFYFASLNFYINFRFFRKGYGTLLGACLCYFLASMAKEEGITLVAVAFVCELVMRDPDSKRDRTWSGWGALAVTGLAAAGMIFSHFEPSSDIARGTVSRTLYFATQWRAYIHYIGNYLWPYGLNFDNLEFGFAQQLWTAENFLFLTLNCALLGYGIKKVWQRKIEGLAILGFYISILPASSIIPLAEPVTDHRAFLPFMFFGYFIFSCLMRGSTRLRLQPKYATAAVVAVISFWSISTFVRNLDWQTSKSIWIDTVLKNPSSPRAKNNLTLEYMAVGDYDFSLKLLEACLKVGPFYYPCHTNLGIVYAMLGKDSLAESHHKKAMELDRGVINSRYHYAQFLIPRGFNAEAIRVLQEANQFAQGMNGPVSDLLAQLQNNESGSR